MACDFGHRLNEKSIVRPFAGTGNDFTLSIRFCFTDKGFKDSNLLRRDLRVPLHGHNERVARQLDRFDNAVGRYGGDAERFGDRADGLSVKRVDLVPACASSLANLVLSAMVTS